MVAYSFKRQFVEPIRSGRKRQTIRAERVGRSRHARVGEEMQLYFGLRTVRTELIGVALCQSVSQIIIDLKSGIVTADGSQWHWPRQLDKFARADGFASWSEMRHFWLKTHPGTDVFHGVLLRWGELR